MSYRMTQAIWNRYKNGLQSGAFQKSHCLETQNGRFSAISGTSAAGTWACRLKGLHLIIGPLEDFGARHSNVVAVVLKMFIVARLVHYPLLAWHVYYNVLVVCAQKFHRGTVLLQILKMLWSKCHLSHICHIFQYAYGLACKKKKNTKKVHK